MPSASTASSRSRGGQGDILQSLSVEDDSRPRLHRRAGRLGRQAVAGLPKQRPRKMIAAILGRISVAAVARRAGVVEAGPSPGRRRRKPARGGHTLPGEPEERGEEERGRARPVR